MQREQNQLLARRLVRAAIRDFLYQFEYLRESGHEHQNGLFILVRVAEIIVQVEDPDDEVLRQRARCSILAKVGKYEFT